MMRRPAWTVVAVAVAAIAWHADPVADSGGVPAPARQAAAGKAAPAEVVTAGEMAPDCEAADLRAWVGWKYRDLLDGGALDPRVRRLLVRRERLVRDPDPAPGALDGVEAELRGVLGDADRAYYEALRDSDREQAQLADYSDGIDNVAPLDDAQRRQLLAAKLRHKAVFERELDDAGLSRPVLSPDERRLAHQRIDSAIERYRDDFLGDASELLDELQFIQLSSYETTEFERTRRELQIAINAR